MKIAVIFITLLLSTVCLSQETVSKDYLMGQFKPQNDSRFTQSGGFYLRKETFTAFQKMQTEAAKSRIRLQIVSATRTFSDQKRLWENKWNAKTPVNTDTGEFLPRPNSREDYLTATQRALRILEFTAMPTTSRHHWGTDLDFNNVNPSYWDTAKGQREYNWLVENAPNFGFCQVYSANRSAGYKEEKWHWSYLPLSQQFTNEFNRIIADMDITGARFVGAETAIEIKAIKNFVLEINAVCK